MIVLLVVGEEVAEATATSVIVSNFLFCFNEKKVIKEKEEQEFNENH